MDSSTPLLTSPPEESKEECLATGGAMATADVPTRPEQLKIHEQPGLTAQDSVSSPSSGTKVNPVKLCIYTLKSDNYCKLTFESGRLTTAEQILSRVREALGLPEEVESVFSVWLTSRHLQLQLKSYHLPCKLFKRWKELLSQFTMATFEEISEDEPILSFQRNAFLPLREERKLLKKQDAKDPANYRKAIDLLYHEAVFHTTRGRYPLTVEEFHTQAGVQAAIKHLEEDTKSDLSRVKSEVGQFYPPHMVPRGGLKVTKFFKKSSEPKGGVVNELAKAYQEALKKCEDPHQLKILYLQLCWHQPYYGSVFFKGIVEKPPQYLKLLAASEKRIVVAVNTECVHLMAAAPPSDVLLYLTFDQLSWEFQPPSSEGDDLFSSLLLEFDSVLGADDQKVAKRVQIFSRQAPMMDAMISRCVDCINKEEERLRQMRLQQGNQEFLEYRIKTYDGDTPRVQKQELNHKEHQLQCTVLTTEGVTVGSGFTLSRLRKRSKGNIAVESIPRDDTAPLTPSTETTEMAKMASQSQAEEGGVAPVQDSSVTSNV